MANDTVMKCGHRPCKCLVEAEEPFCSESCANRENEVSSKCLCGHPECSGPDEAVLEDPLLDVEPIGEPDPSPA